MKVKMALEGYSEIYEGEEFFGTFGSGYVDHNFSDYNLSVFFMYGGPTGPMDGFKKAYGKAHGYLSIFICIFGIITNIINVIVLTRKHMASPTNSILKALGIVDMIALFTYILYVVYAKFYPHSDPSRGYVYNESKAWIDYAIFWPHITFTFEICGMWLTITLALFQYITVCHIKIGPKVCTMRNANIAIVFVVCLSLFMCLPEYLLYESKPAPTERNMTGWFLGDSYIVDESPGLKRFYLIFYGIVVKILACVLLIVLSGLLIRTIYLSDKRRGSFARQNSDERRNSTRRRVHRRTTIMLVAVLMLFVLAEFPAGLIAFIGGCNERLFQTIFLPMADFFVLLVIINSSVKFILYCTMSQQFRKTFMKLLCGRLPKVLRVKAVDLETVSSSSFRSRAPGCEESQETHLDEQ